MSRSPSDHWLGMELRVSRGDVVAPQRFERYEFKIPVQLSRIDDTSEQVRAAKEAP